MLACEKGHTEIVRLLVEKGARVDLEARDKSAVKFLFIGDAVASTLVSAFLVVAPDPQSRVSFGIG